MSTYFRVLVEILYIYCPALPAPSAVHALLPLLALPAPRFLDLFEPEDRRITPEKIKI